MNDDGGFVRSFRRKWENPVFRNKVEVAVWAWMIDIAQWQDKRLATKFGPIELHRGELVIAERELSEDFGLHRNTLRTLLQRMVDDGMISLIRDRIPHRAGTIVHIVKYDEYQCAIDHLQIVEDRKKTKDQTEEGPKEDRSGTKNKESKELNNNNHARAEPVLEVVQPAAEPVAEPLAEPVVLAEPSAEPARSTPKPPGRDPNSHALIQGFSDAIEQVFGKEHARPNFHVNDEIFADRFMAVAAEVGIQPGKAIDMLRLHFVDQLTTFRDRGNSPPKVLKFFYESAPKLLRDFARDRDMPTSTARSNGSGYGRKPFGGGDAATSTAIRQPWQDIQSRLVAKHLFGPAKQLAAAAAQKGDAMANLMAVSLEEQHLGKKPMAAQAA